MRSKEWSRMLAALTLTAPIPYVAFAQTYLNDEQASNILFPGLKLEPASITLTSDELKQIKKAKNDDQGMSPTVRLFWGPNHEALIIDRVLGKHEFITYAVAINPDASVKGIEVMIYNETYGYQIREASWRQHFTGKTVQDPLKLDKDIPNISGATLSSKHVTDGVRRVIQTYSLLRARP